MRISGKDCSVYREVRPALPAVPRRQVERTARRWPFGLVPYRSNASGRTLLQRNVFVPALPPATVATRANFTFQHPRFLERHRQNRRTVPVDHVAGLSKTIASRQRGHSR
jgi:hypothetical protein